ncbi:MAG TPA: hypothetical protein PKD54_09120, partial [Pirellulaceae bacterium]|nr:hypothetical protein [Pirellulaceae bacterium]
AKRDEQSDATERKWRYDVVLKSRSPAPYPPADRRRSAVESMTTTKTIRCDVNPKRFALRIATMIDLRLIWYMHY